MKVLKIIICIAFIVCLWQPFVFSGNNILEFRFADDTKKDNNEEVMMEDEWGKKEVFIDKECQLSETDIKFARAEEFFFSSEKDEAQKANYALYFKFTEAGAAKVKEITGRNVNRQLAIILNGKILFIAAIREQLSIGEMQLTGNFTKKETQAAAKQINSAIELLKVE
ncbi:MAG: hypothetical protein KJ915_02135 [Candidatus Omnitrophica bacterium]|nr:hypothetical protein [Candidatus Omnitrophota bacterium]